MASSICKFLQYLISTLTQGAKGGHLLRLTYPVCCGEGGTVQTNITGVCGEFLQCLGHTGFAPAHDMCAFLDYTVQFPRCCAGELSEAGPGLSALPRSKPLRLRFLGTPQKHRLGWACILCPLQIQAAQATRCLASALSPGGQCVLSPPWSQPLVFLGAERECCLRCAVYLLGELISSCDRPGGCQPSRIKGRLG